jgi:ribose transport system ATP-binding protein
MRAGAVAAEGPSTSFDRAALIEVMGGASHTAAEDTERRPTVAPTGAECVRVPARDGSAVKQVSACAGEVIGLAGLAGHGQTRLLHEIFHAGRRGDAAFRNGEAAFVAGDRQTDGVFPRWSIAENITIRSLPDLKNGPLISPSREKEMGESWRQRMGIRTPDMADNILSLSGGNQQKALFARALGSNANIILMDDPMRGVDVSTKLDMYAFVRSEAANGRCFFWYTTETEELTHCDRVYVFHDGLIVAEVPGHGLREETIIQLSFQGAAQ